MRLKISAINSDEELSSPPHAGVECCAIVFRRRTIVLYLALLSGLSFAFVPYYLPYISHLRGLYTQPLTHYSKKIITAITGQVFITWSIMAEMNMVIPVLNLVIILSSYTIWIIIPFTGGIINEIVG